MDREVFKTNRKYPFFVCDTEIMTETTSSGISDQLRNKSCVESRHLWMGCPVYKHISRRWMGCHVCKHKSRRWMGCPIYKHKSRRWMGFPVYKHKSRKWMG